MQRWGASGHPRAGGEWGGVGPAQTGTVKQEPSWGSPGESLEAKRLCLPAPNLAEPLADSMILTEP